MKEKIYVFSRKKALFTVLIIAALLLLLIFLRWHGKPADRLLTPEDREKFLISLGWQVELKSEEEKTVIIPQKLEGVMEEYNRMQQEQGMDLSPYCGEKCTQYSYSLKNYPSDNKNVYLTLYIYKGRLIAADIHTNSVNGFMQGIYPPNK